MRTAYSSLKVLHHPEQLSKLRQGKWVAPIHVQLVPTNRCNQACEGCAYRLPGYSSNEQFSNGHSIEWPKLQELVDDCKAMGVKAIQVTGGGEPMVHPRFLDLCAKIMVSGIDLAIVTNGSRWSNDHAAMLARSKWVRFSLDAGSAVTYAAYRHVPITVYDQVRDHVRQVAKSQHRQCLLGIGFVVNNRNWQEVVQAAVYAKEDGADNFRISALFTPQGLGYFTRFRKQAQQLCKEAEQVSDGTKFQVVNLFDDRLEDLFSAAPRYNVCGYNKLVTYLGADCNLYTCCMNAYNRRGYLGSFADQSFKQLWFSQSVQDRLASFDATGCPRCMYNAINKTIDYAISPDPIHVNFV